MVSREQEQGRNYDQESLEKSLLNALSNLTQPNQGNIFKTKQWACRWTLDHMIARTIVPFVLKSAMLLLTPTQGKNFKTNQRTGHVIKWEDIPKVLTVVCIHISQNFLSQPSTLQKRNIPLKFIHFGEKLLKFFLVHLYWDFVEIKKSLYTRMIIWLCFFRLTQCISPVIVLKKRNLFSSNCFELKYFYFW